MNRVRFYATTYVESRWLLLHLIACLFLGGTSDLVLDLYGDSQIVEFKLGISLAFGATLGTWLNIYAYGKFLRTRSFTCALPVGRFQWLRWSMGLLVMAFLLSFGMRAAGSVYFAIPFGLYGICSVVETIDRCVFRRFQNFTLIAVVGIVLSTAWIARISVVYPNGVMLWGIVVSTGLPLVFGSRSIWHGRMSYKNQSRWNFYPQDARDVENYWQKSLVKAGEGERFINSWGSYGETVRNLTISYCGALRIPWSPGLNRFATHLILPTVLVVGYGLIGFVLYKVQPDRGLDFVDSKGNPFLTIMPIMIVGMSLSSSPGLTTLYSVLGRSELSSVTLSSFQRYTWMVVAAQLCVFAGYELIGSYLLGRGFPLMEIVFLMLLSIAVAGVLLVVFSFSVKKKIGKVSNNWFRSVIPVFFYSAFATFAQRYFNDTFLKNTADLEVGPVLVQVGTSLVVFLVFYGVCYWGCRWYLREFYKRGSLVAVAR